MKLKKAPKAIVRNVIHMKNILDQRQQAIRMMSSDGDKRVSNRHPLSHDIQESTNYASLILEGHGHHHEDTNETFTADELMYLPGYTYLPSSCPGGPRCQMLRFADAMTIAAKLGGPHFFTTFTTSPSWEEFHKHRRDCPYIEDNMDIESRIFKEKLALFLEDLCDGLFFENRKLMYIIHVIEFQWRGHPHAHIVFRLEGERLAPEEIDRMITTSYTQCKTADEKELLKSFMTHCCKKGGCLKEGKPCSQFFPKELSPTYHDGNRGYPAYQRLIADDQFIVPCVLQMIAKYRCHINVRQHVIVMKAWIGRFSHFSLYTDHQTEVCSDVFIFEYLFKYICKGNVRLQVENVSKYVDNKMDHRVPQNVINAIKNEMTTNFKKYEKDEINQFELMHYIPATQATWKFLGYRTMQNQPSVHVIDVDLPGNEVVHFKPDDIDSMQDCIANKVSAQELYWNRPDGDVFDVLFWKTSLTCT